MSKKVVLLPMGSSNHRRQPLLQQSKSSSKAGTRLGEAVGGTAAVCCCCPCALANIVYLAIYKVPASICHRVLKKRKQRRRRMSLSEGMNQPKRRCTCGCCDDVGARVHPSCGGDDLKGGVKSMSLGVLEEDDEEDKDVVELVKEMWDRFYGTGFWRSSSQRDSSSTFSSNSQRGLIVTVSAPNLQVLNVSTL